MEQSEIRRIGRILKERRLQLGYTQEYAAEKAGISYSYYTKIERGQQLPSLEVAHGPFQNLQPVHGSLAFMPGA